MADEQIKKYCDTCKKTMDVKHFYFKLSGEPMNTCKKCLCLGLNVHQPETAFKILKEVDIPYIPWEWLTLQQRYSPDPNRPKNPQSVLGRYIAKMRLAQFKEFTWDDTPKFVEEHKNNLEREDEIKQRENERYKASLIEQGRSEEEASIILKELEEPVEIFDFGSMLTRDEKMTMTIKWGKSYKEDEWIRLERMYQEMEESYDISTASHRDYLVKICKVSLRMDNLMDVGDDDGFNKLAKTYDTLMKSAKFTASQTKENDSSLAICEMFAIAERKLGIVEKYKGWVDEPLDIVDITIKDMQKYTENLVKGELNLETQIESAIEMMKLQAESDRLNDEGEPTIEEKIEADDGVFSFMDFEEGE